MELIQVTPPGGQNLNYCKWKFKKKEVEQKSLTKYWKNIARGTTDPGYWVQNLNKLFHLKYFQIDFSQQNDSSYKLNTLGPLCLWQCFFNKFVSTFPPRFFHLFSTFSTCQVAFLELVLILATRWRYLNCLPMWPPDGTTCISCRIGQQLALLELVTSLVTKWCHLH